MHQRWSGLGRLLSWPIGVEASMVSPAFLGEALKLPPAGGKDLTAGMGNTTAFSMGKQSGTCISRQNTDQVLAPTASAMDGPKAAGWSKGCSGCDFSHGACLLSNELRRQEMWELPGKRSFSNFSLVGLENFLN